MDILASAVNIFAETVSSKTFGKLFDVPNKSERYIYRAA